MSQCDPSKICSICDQKGLALLPLRYAVARPTPLSAPPLQAPFGQGLEQVPLPGDSAHYTLRLLRGGYLYVFNERRGEWKAYVVTTDAYLFEYDIHDKTPPNLEGAVPCKRMAKSASSRCVMIPDATRSTKIWLGFSDVAWTARVLERHRQQACRERHMRCIDIGAWSNSQGQQAHLAGLATAHECVAEYQLPAPGDGALSDSPQVFQSGHDDLEPFLASALASSQGVPAAMVALMDPVGIALELNGLIHGQVERYESNEERHWKKSTSSAIQGLRHMLEEDALARALTVQKLARHTHQMDSLLYFPQDDDEALSAEQEQQVRADAWARYTDNYRETERLAFEEQSHAALEQFMQATLTPLVQAFVGWFWSAQLRQHLGSNHDSGEWDSGLCFTDQVSACLTGLTGHQLIIDKLLEDLRGRYDDPDNLTLRALVLNNDQVARALEDAATPAIGAANPYALRNVLNAFGLVLDHYDQGLLGGGLARVARLTHQISGAVVSSLGKPLRAGASGAYDLSVRYRMVGLLEALSGKQIVSLSTIASDGQMAHIISEKIALLQPGIDRKALQDKISQELKQLDQQPGTRKATGQKNARQKKTFTWNLMYDADVGKTLSLDHRGKIKEGSTVLLTQDQLRKVITDRHLTLPRLANMEVGVSVVGGILDGWNGYMAMELMEKEGVTVKSGINLTAAAFSLTGAGVDMADRVLKRYPEVGSRLARPLGETLNKWLIRVGGLRGIAKGLSVIGGLLTAVVDGISAKEALDKNDYPIFILRATTASLGVAATAALAITTMTAGVGIALFLTIAALSLLGEWIINLLRENKIEQWLDKTPFGNNESSPFASWVEQDTAWNELLGLNAGGAL